MVGVRTGVHGVLEDAKNKVLAVYLISILCDHYFCVSSDSQIKYILTLSLCWNEETELRRNLVFLCSVSNPESTPFCLWLIALSGLSVSLTIN